MLIFESKTKCSELFNGQDKDKCEFYHFWQLICFENVNSVYLQKFDFLHEDLS